MKKHIPAALAAGLLLAAASAHATDSGTFFINGNLGQSTYHDQTFSDNTDTTGAVRAGYVWQSYTVDFGLEAGYVDLGSASTTLVTGLPGVNPKFTLKSKGPLLGANIKYKFQNKMFVYARGGYFHSTFDASVSGYGSDDYHGNGAYFGAGVGYDITQHFGLGLSFDDYHGRARVDGGKVGESIGAYSAFAEYRF